MESRNEFIDPLSLEVFNTLPHDEVMGIIKDIVEPCIPPIWKGDTEVCLKPGSHYFYVHIKEDKERLIEGLLSDYYTFVHYHFISRVAVSESAVDKMDLQVQESYRQHIEKYAGPDYREKCKEIDKRMLES